MIGTGGCNDEPHHIVVEVIAKPVVASHHGSAIPSRSHMIAHIVVACLKHIQESAVARGFIAVENGFERLCLSPAAIDEGAIATAFVLHILMEEPVGHPLTCLRVKCPLRLHLHEIPCLCIVAYLWLTSVHRADDAQVLPLSKQIGIGALIHRLQCPCTGLASLRHGNVAGIHVFAGIDISQGNVSTAGIHHLPLLGRHICFSPHHDRGFLCQ